MSTISVPVQFQGIVQVTVPDASPEIQQALAKRIALCRILATIENPDAPDDDACDEFSEHCQLDEATAENLWGQASADYVQGIWTFGQ